MAVQYTTISAQLPFTNTQAAVFNCNDHPAVGGSGGAIQRVMLKTTAACYIAFDTAANTAGFLLEATNDPIVMELQATKISALGSSGSGTLYILGVR